MALINQLFFFLFIGLIASAPIVPLNDLNFTNFTKTNTFTFIVVHAPWCDQCESLLKEVNIANEYVSNLDPPRFIATVDLEDNSTKITEDFLQINGVPAMFLSLKDKYIEYIGLQKASSIITFILKNSGKAVNTLTTQDHIKDFINPKTAYMCVISFNSSYDKEFQDIAKEIKYSLFAKCDSEECLQYFKPQSDFIILKPFEIETNQRVDLSYKSETKLMRSIYLNSFPAIGKFSDFGIDIVFRNEISSICFIEVDRNDDSDTDSESFVLRKFIEKHYQQYYIFVFDIKDKKDRELLGFFGYEPNDFKSNELFLIDFPTKQFAIYRLKQDLKNSRLSIEGIEAFLSDVKEKRIEREKRSEAEPKDQPKKNFKVIVGKTFEKEVLLNNDQIVIIGYVIANCEKCDLLQQIFDGITDKYANREDILFGLIDPVFNDIPGLVIDTPFSPLIHYYPKDKSKPYVTFNKEITTKYIIDFIKEQEAKATGKEYNQEL